MASLLLVALGAAGLRGQTAIDDDISALVKAARVYDEDGMRGAVAAIVRRGPPCLKRVAHLLSHENANVRWQAMIAVDHIGAAPTWLRDSIIASTQDVDGDVRGAAIVALSRLFPKHQQTLLRVQSLSRDDQPLVRVHAAGAEWRIRRSKHAVTVLLDLTTNRDWMAADQARRYLVEIGKPGHNGLVKMLATGKPTQQLAAVQTLRLMKALPSDAATVLARLVEHRNTQLSLEALRCLAQNPAGWEFVVAAFEGKDASLRLRAVTALPHVPVARRPVATRLLLPLLDDDDPSLQLAALRALRTCAVAGPLLDKRVARLLDDRRPDHRAAAVALVGQLKLPLATAQLRRLVERESVDYIRREAARIIAASTRK